MNSSPQTVPTTHDSGFSKFDSMQSSERIKKLKFASFAVPMIGGVYSVAQRLRRSLGEKGIDIRWIGIGQRGVQAWNEPGMESEREFGNVVAESETNEKAQARAVIAHLINENYDGVFVDVLGGNFQANIVRYLPQHFMRILIVHNITLGTYAYARAVRDYVHTTIGVSPRIRADLIQYHGFSIERTFAIPNGVELNRYQALETRITHPVLRVLMLGRIDSGAKGVFDLPKIARCLKKSNIHFTVAGDGPDLAALRKSCKGLAEKISFLGAVSADNVPQILNQHDVLLFPSRYEGLPLVLVEAMATGCVPIASRIHGVTDFVINDGETGLLFPVGSVNMAADAIQRLANDRAWLGRLASSAKASVTARFGTQKMAEAYFEQIQRLKDVRPPGAGPLDVESWSYPSELKPNWRRFVPTPIKNIARVVLENMR